ncbi:hypothetical protein A2721_00615 [Candidatus Gottesmanbacteria bacterium RIFCSPHIGHO2_01_FULL_47_48]|uniref:Uncharacterized protein n=1 Tax=Candidatus Gottesmanbacteria bacterium RIFCSPHIGHO2_01_FULL_47_48 TaxID=1798381 RepID=A0A1F5ZZ45_9BACT|nr:MAG: hypothetical protein A2721_00615 [Candidatus Gottesmanbacteria bacterium RIFCSPHIGHO2_01_FULL_47_48]
MVLVLWWQRLEAFGFQMELLIIKSYRYYQPWLILLGLTLTTSQQNFSLRTLIMLKVIHFFQKGPLAVICVIEDDL